MTCPNWLLSAFGRRKRFFTRASEFYKNLSRQSLVANGDGDGDGSTVTGISLTSTFDGITAGDILFGTLRRTRR